MNKQELLSTYTAEQLAEMVEKYQKSFDAFRFSDTFLKAGLFDNPASAAYEAEIRVKEKKIEELERQLKEMDKISVVVGGITKTYPIEEIGDIVRAYEDIKHCKEHNGDHLHSEEYLKIISLNREVTKLQSEVGKYRKAFEDAKKERDCQIAEYQKKIEELENKEVSNFLPTEPIKVADMLISAKIEPTEINSDGAMVVHKQRNFYLSELRQIAEHLLVYCNHN